MKNNPLKELNTFGQSVWLDYIRRDMIKTGKLKSYIDKDGIRGITSNPTIFEKAIAGSSDYDDPLMRLRAEGKTDTEILDELTIQDIQMAADLFLPVYESTQGQDGFISLEISPLLAHQEEESIQAVIALYKRVKRMNVMIKVPATEAGIRAHERLIGMGIPINMTLIFSLETYEGVARAYINGLKRLTACGQPIGTVRSVASVFVSRVDTLADQLIAEQIQMTENQEEAAGLKSLTGKIALANAKMIYQKFKILFQEPAFIALKKLGAHVQRPLWASTGTKNPDYSDVRYIEELIGPHTVNTVPPATMDAFRDHGKLRMSLEEGLENAKASLNQLDTENISLREITQKLQDEGLKAFSDSYQNLLHTITKKKERLLDRHRMHYG